MPGDDIKVLSGCFQGSFKTMRFSESCCKGNIRSLSPDVFFTADAVFKFSRHPTFQTQYMVRNIIGRNFKVEIMLQY